MPGLETVLVNLGGWAAILWGLANKIISRLDSRIVQIERQLEKLATMPRAVQRLHREIRKHRTHMHGQPSQADPTPETPS
jgi:cell division protein FtsB